MAASPCSGERLVTQNAVRPDGIFEWRHPVSISHLASEKLYKTSPLSNSSRSEPLKL